MTFLVLGSTGWVGRRIVSSGKNLIPANITSRASQVEFKDWLRGQKVDCYINCIGKTAGTSGEMEWANVGIVEELVSHARRTGSRIIQLGSAAEYGTYKKEFFSEDDEAMPISQYGNQKLLANQILNEYVSEGGSGVATRLFNVVGPGQSSSTALGQVVSRVRKQISNSEIVIDNFDVVRDYISIDFTVDVIKHLSTSSFNGTLNIGSGRGTMLIDLVTEIASTFSVNVTQGELQENRVTRAVADTTRMSQFGYISPNLELTELARKALLT